MPLIEDVVAEEARQIVSIGMDIAEFDKFDDTLDAFEDKMRRAYEEILGDLAEVPARCVHMIDVLEGFLLTTMRQIIQEYVDIDGVLDNLPTQRKRAIEQMETIITEYSREAGPYIRMILSDLEGSYPDLRRVKKVLDIWNEEEMSLKKLDVSRRGWRDLVRHELVEGRRNDSLPQNPALRNRIYHAYSDDMFEAAEAANPARANDFRLLKDNYTRAMELIERKFREEFAKKLVERAENHPLLAETNRRKNEEKKNTARERQRTASASGLGNFLFLWLVASLLFPEPVLNSLGLDKGFVFAVIALVSSSLIFLPVFLPHILLKRYQFRRFDRLHPPPADETDYYAAERKSLIELIAEECGFSSGGWVEETELKKAKEAKAEAERRRKAAGKQERSTEELCAEGDVRNAELTIEIERRAREATAQEAKQDAETARKKQRDVVATGLDRIVVGIPRSLAVIQFLGSVILSGYMITRWLGRHEIGIFLASCLAVFLLICFLNDLVKKHQLRRFDRDNPPPTEDTT